MCTMIVGEAANFAAYAFAPAILVTPLGALEHHRQRGARAPRPQRAPELRSRTLGAVLCIVGSVTIVLNAPEERRVSGVAELAALASRPTFLAYALFVVLASAHLAWNVAPTHGATLIMVPVGICSCSSARYR